MKVSVLIKAYNEESKIQAAIESSLSEIEGLDGEVVLADSRSRDRTVEIALRYPIRVVEFLNEADRGCGAGAQLAYQHSFGDYVYILDGDMRFRPGFLKEAVQYLDEHPEVYGVGGVVNDIINDNMEFRTRAARAGHRVQAGDVPKLDCGGLYRRSALEAVGYFSDRNLHSYEELDLGARLRATGGRLTRIGMVSVDHFTHTSGSYQLLWKRTSSGYSLGAGEIFKAAFGRPHFWSVIRELRIVRVLLFLFVWIAVVIAAAASIAMPWGPLAALVILALPVLAMGFRRRSLKVGFFSVISWFFYSIGFLRGLAAPRKSPMASIPSRVLREPHSDFQPLNAGRA